MFCFGEFQVAIKESETLIGSNGDHEVKKTDGAAASADIATLEDPSSVAEGSAALLTSQGKLVGKITTDVESIYI